MLTERPAILDEQHERALVDLHGSERVAFHSGDARTMASRSSRVGNASSKRAAVLEPFGSVSSMLTSTSVCATRS